MDCFVGAATGAFKGATLRENIFQNLNEIKSLDPKEDEITSMIWNNEEQEEILIARMNRQLQIYDTEENEFNSFLVVEGGSGPIKGIHKSNDKIFTIVESGEIKVYDENSLELVNEWKTGPGVAMMRGSLDLNKIVTCGKNHLVKTFDAETGKQNWCAKNVPPNMLGLDIPIMGTDVRFIPNQNTILEATKLHEMRLYDPRAQRKPIKILNFMENPIMCTSLTYRENIVIAANSIGEIGLFDLRSKIHPMCKFKGQTGSIRSIDAHPSAPFFASVGIDRFLRVHDLQTRKLAHKIYCKTRLNRVLLKHDLSILHLNKPKKEIDEDETEYGQMKSNGYKSDNEESDDNENEDEIWSEMKSTGDKNSKKRVFEEESNTNVETRKCRKLEKIRRKRKESINEVNEEQKEEPQKKKKITKIPKHKNSSPNIENVSRVEKNADIELIESPKPKKKKLLKKKNILNC